MKNLNELLWSKEELEDYLDNNFQKKVLQEGKLIMMLDNCLGRACGGGYDPPSIITPNPGSACGN